MSLCNVTCFEADRLLPWHHVSFDISPPAADSKHPTYCNEVRQSGVEQSRYLVLLGCSRNMICTRIVYVHFPKIRRWIGGGSTQIQSHLPVGRMFQLQIEAVIFNCLLCSTLNKIVMCFLY